MEDELYSLIVREISGHTLFPLLNARANEVRNLVGDCYEVEEVGRAISWALKYDFDFLRELFREGNDCDLDLAASLKEYKEKYPIELVKLCMEIWKEWKDRGDDDYGMFEYFEFKDCDVTTFDELGGKLKMPRGPQTVFLNYESFRKFYKYDKWKYMFAAFHNLSKIEKYYNLNDDSVLWIVDRMFEDDDERIRDFEMSLKKNRPYLLPDFYARYLKYSEKIIYGMMERHEMNKKYFEERNYESIDIVSLKSA